MTKEESEKQEQDQQHKDAAVKPDPTTLHKTDPQENMEGPLSSLMHNTGGTFENGESKEEADRKRDNDM